jgi:ketosteroid isomerase-like protein
MQARIVILLVLSMLVAAPLGAAASEKSEVEAAMKAQTEAWNRGDLPAFLGFYLPSPTMSYTAGGILLKGYDALAGRFREAYAAHPQAMGKMRLDDVEVTPMGADHALAVGRFHLDQSGRALDGIFTFAWTRTPQGWRILHDHRTLAAAQKPDAVERADGLRIEDLVDGTGQAAMYGQKLTVHYTGWLSNGQKFDSSLDRGQPFEFVLGQGRVIKGWEEGLLGMKVGGKRRLTIPPALGYGARGAGSAVPPNATLIFEVELLGVGRP